MKQLLMSKGGKGGATMTATAMIVILVLAVLIFGSYFIYRDVQQRGIEEKKGAVCTIDTECAVGQTCKSGVCETPSTTLKGKPLTVSSFAYDQTSATNAKAAAKLYVISNPVENEAGDKVTGVFAEDGATLSTSARTDTTSGLTVDGKVWAIASNDTWYGQWDKQIPTEQQLPLDLKVWKVATQLKIRIEDKDEVEITNGTSGAKNLTLAASQSEKFHEIEFEMNKSNMAFNLGAFFFDLNANSNVSAMTGDGTTTGAATVAYSKTTTGYQYTSTDDQIWKLAEPVLLTEWQSIKFNDITVTADGDGCAASVTDAMTLYAVDYLWVKSNQENAMIFAAESDADSPLDIGMTNPSAYIYCYAP